MDATAASIAVSAKYKSSPRLPLLALAFAAFQGVMALLGFVLGLPFESQIAQIDHWIAFTLLGFLGVKMILESRSPSRERNSGQKLSFQVILSLALATSIDALVVGIGFHALPWPILSSAGVIGLVTFFMCLLGVLLGKKSLTRFHSHAEILGGVILIALGTKILIEHLLA